MNILGFDIGGTKCAVITAKADGEKIEILKKSACPTDLSISPYEMLTRLVTMAEEILENRPDAVGISCGGPLDSKKGLILSPPNLPGWDEIEITAFLSKHYTCPVYLQNDANACAVAEWKYGAGKGTENMIFLTFGTGLGAGLIIGGRLYPGSSFNAGEVGHIRLAENGPTGYGKEGSFEGFCSGGGLAQLGYALSLEEVKKGNTPLYFNKEKDLSAKDIAEAARRNDATALRVFDICGKRLAQGLSVLIDILNPEAIILGGIYPRCADLLLPTLKKELEKEALPLSLKSCRILPAALGESIGDYGAVCAVFM